MASTQLLLQIWLYFVAAMRLLSVVLGYFFPEKLLGNVFGKLPAVAKEARDNQELDQAKNLLARTFAVWTSMTCMLCVLCALNLENDAVIIATILSFVAALVFFLLELLVFKSMFVRNIIPMAVIASSSIVFLVLYHF